MKRFASCTLFHGSTILRQASSLRPFTSLHPSPEILFSDNHLLVVNKPPGYLSVPNLRPSPKCLLSHLKRLKLGGGRNNDFLLPLHRLDQPCSGVLMFGKTSKAASRITKLWKKKLVQKEYQAVVSSSRVVELGNKSVSIEREWHNLKGVMQSRKDKSQRSVRIFPFSTSLIQKEELSSRTISIDWREIESISKNDPSYTTLQVRTNEGARHMIRAILSQVGNCPIEGDLRYNATATVLPNKSVALHASRILLDNSLQLGSLKTYEFEAPLPLTWEHYFGIVQPKVE